VQGQAISPPSRSRGEDTGIDHSTHALPKIFGNTGHITLNHISSSHTIRSQDVADSFRFLTSHQRNVCRATWIMFNAFHHMGPWSLSGKINDPNSSLMATATVSHGDVTRMISTTF
jgi:hypothetical protein